MDSSRYPKICLQRLIELYVNDPNNANNWVYQIKGFFVNEHFEHVLTVLETEPLDVEFYLTNYRNFL